MCKQHNSCLLSPTTDGSEGFVIDEPHLILFARLLEVPQLFVKQREKSLVVGEAEEQLDWFEHTN